MMRTFFPKYTMFPKSCVDCVVLFALLATSRSVECSSELSVSQTGRGWFSAISSHRKIPKGDITFPLTLSMSATLSGMMTYSVSATGVSLSLPAPANYSTDCDEWLYLNWTASASSPASSYDKNAGAVLRVDETNCGTQRSDVALFHSTCSASNTGGCDTNCYCSSVPCVLEQSTPQSVTHFLGKSFQPNATADLTPLALKLSPSFTEPRYNERVIRLTPRTSSNVYASSFFYETITIYNATIVLMPKNSTTPVPKPVPENTDLFCTDNDLQRSWPELLKATSAQVS